MSNPSTPPEDGYVSVRRSDLKNPLELTHRGHSTPPEPRIKCPACESTDIGVLYGDGTPPVIICDDCGWRNDGQGRKPSTLSGLCGCDGPTRIDPNCKWHGPKAALSVPSGGAPQGIERQIRAAIEAQSHGHGAIQLNRATLEYWADTLASGGAPDLRELAKKWRKEASEAGASGDQQHATTLSECADELDAALSSSVSPKGEQ